ncbi:MAG: hypothetical protein LBC70_09380, partial [Chitinispirillales bacterium]|nr:hypothetical protein [Chitinispirillales bacterium]
PAEGAAKNKILLNGFLFNNILVGARGRPPPLKYVLNLILTFYLILILILILTFLFILYYIYTL